MDQGVLAGQTGFITGGSGGIGGAAAKFLLRDGAAVLLMGRRSEALERKRAQLLLEVPNGKVEIHAGDASNVEDVKRGLQKAHAIGGRLDIIVSTVGSVSFAPTLMLDVAGFKDALDSNLLTAFIAVRYGVPLMDYGGSVVFISSSAASAPFPWLIGYASAKAALEHFTRTVADELASAKIRVNCVRAGMTRTDLTEGMFANAELMAKFDEQVPLKRLGDPDDIGQAIRYLTGPESSWVTGHILTVDGGQALRRNPDMTSTVRQFIGEAKMDLVQVGKSPL